MNSESWPGDWMRAALGLSVLKTLDAGPTYGYAIATALEGAGLGSVKGGTLYPLLARLETAGHVTTQWQKGDGGPGRKYFSLTDSGRAELVSQVQRWQEFNAHVTQHLSGKGNQP